MGYQIHFLRDCSQITPLFQPHFRAEPFHGQFSGSSEYSVLIITPWHWSHLTNHRQCSGPRSCHVRRQGRIVTFAFLLYYVQSYPWAITGAITDLIPLFAVFIVNLCCQHVNSVIWKGDQPGLEPRAFEFVPQCASATPLAWSETYNSITSSGQELAVFIVLLTGSWLRLLTSDNVSDDTALGNAYSAITVFTILQYFSVPFVHFCICFFVQPSEYQVHGCHLHEQHGVPDSIRLWVIRYIPLALVFFPICHSCSVLIITPWHWSHLTINRLCSVAFLLYYVQSYPPWK